MANISARLLREIEPRPSQCCTSGPLTPLRKLWIAMRTDWRDR